ncbi:hypothetical protein [Streptomyces sp. NPDC004135]
MKVTYTPGSRDEALAALGPHWPARPGSTVVRHRYLANVTDGVLTVQETDGQPGTAWFVVDGLIVPQDAGPAPYFPGDEIETVPDPAPATPPLTP